MRKLHGVERSKGYGKSDTFFLAFGAMIGSGWMTLVGEWIIRAGAVGAILAFILGGIMVLSVSQLYAELTSAMPVTGGVFVFSERAFNKTIAFVCMWALILSYISVISVQAVAFPTLLSYLIPQYIHGYLYTIDGFDVHTTWLVVTILMSALMVFVNIAGKKTATSFRNFTTVLVIIVGIIFFAGGLWNGDPANLIPEFPNGISGVFKVMVMTPFLYIGFDVIPQAASAMNIPAKKIGQILVIAVLTAILWYVLIVLCVGLTHNGEEVIASSLASVEAMMHAYGNSHIASSILLVGGIAGTLSCWNAFYTGCSCAISMLAENHILPEFFARKHPRYGTPYIAILSIGIVSTCAVFLGQNILVCFTSAGSLGTVLTYFIVSLSFIRLRRQEPELIRPYKIRHARLISTIAVFSCLFLLVLYIPGMPSSLAWPFEWGIILIWTFLGIVLYKFPAIEMHRKKF